MLGRQAELDELGTGLDEAEAGRGSLALVAGEAGVGKSRLVRETAALARSRGAVVLAGQATESHRRVPLKPLAEALCSAFRSSGPPGGQELAPYRTVLGHLVPEWREGGDRSSPDFLVVLAEGILRLLRVTAAGRSYKGAAVVHIVEAGMPRAPRPWRSAASGRTLSSPWPQR